MLLLIHVVCFGEGGEEGIDFYVAFNSLGNIAIR